MIRNVLTHIGGVENYGIFSVIFFFLCFAGMLVWAFQLKRPHLDRMGRLPLGDDSAARNASTDPSDTRHE